MSCGDLEIGKVNLCQVNEAIGELSINPEKTLGRFTNQVEERVAVGAREKIFKEFIVYLRDDPNKDTNEVLREAGIKVKDEINEHLCCIDLMDIYVFNPEKEGEVDITILRLKSDAEYVWRVKMEYTEFKDMMRDEGLLS